MTDKEALEKQKTGHWITLEEWKNDFKGFINELSMPEDDYNGIIEYIDEIPNEARLIPVSERLPEPKRIVIASTKNVVYPEARYTPTGWEWAYKSGAVYYWIKIAVDVVAWMPLPKPYKEREDKK